MPHSSPFGRVLTAMVSPMLPDGSLDKESAIALAKHLAGGGHDGIVVNGTTGESPTLSADESIDLVATVAAAVGDQVAVVAGRRVQLHRP
ncbi:MAG: dihydrodipicolinate synthase family protein [Tetrasphaera sp.]